MIKNALDRTMLAARWLLVPIYLGLSLMLLALVVKFYQVLFELLPNVLQKSDIDLILTALLLIDFVLIAGLIVMVMYSSFETFVARLNIPEHKRMSWLNKLDAGSLKLKVAAAIVAISSIHLLKAFMNLEKIPNDKIIWYVVVHLTFVISAVLMGLMDHLANKDAKDSKEPASNI